MKNKKILIIIVAILVLILVLALIFGAFGSAFNGGFNGGITTTTNSNGGGSNGGGSNGGGSNGGGSNGGGSNGGGSNNNGQVERYSEGLEYALNSDGSSYTVMGIGTCTDEYLYIPPTHNDLPVIAINECAFISCTQIKSVVIPDSVILIGYEAFMYCSNLESVQIGNGVERIEKQTFYHCTSLKNFTFTSSIKFFGENTFMQTTSMENVYYIGELEDWLCIEFETSMAATPLCYTGNLYFNGNLVTSVSIPEGTKSIPQLSFFGCDSLVELNIPNTVTAIGSSAFAYTRIRTLTIPDSVTTIHGGAFDYCRDLLRIEIPKSVIYLRYGCSFTSAIEIYMAATVSDMVALSGNRCVKKVISTEYFESNLKFVGDYAFYDDGTEVYLVRYFGKEKNVVLPEYNGRHDYKINSSTFLYNEYVETITIPASIGEVCDDAFFRATALQKVIFEGSYDEWNQKYTGYYDSTLAQVTIVCTDRTFNLNAK